MGVLPLDGPILKNHGPIIEEIKGLIRVYKDGHVERLPVVPDVPPTRTVEHDVSSVDLAIDRLSARFYVPETSGLLPLLVYFHGGGFCVGSTSWSYYHEFLARLASRAGLLVMSVNYRLAPEHRLPAAFDDGLAAAKWATGPNEWRSRYDISKVFLGGDSAGATIAHHVGTRMPSSFRGLILIQPFFGGEKRTRSERRSSNSVLSLEASDCYWRLALPAGSNRDHHWCNPLAKVDHSSTIPPMLVCVSEMDILRDRDLDFCRAMRIAGKFVQLVVYKGVGHAFQILHASRTAQLRTCEMIAHIKAFIHD